MKIFKKAAACALCSAVWVGTMLPAEASLSQPAVVSANPADTTPHIVLDDTSYSVYAFEQVGNTVYAGGRFQQVQDPAQTTTYSRQNFVAFDGDTGVVSPLNLSFDGMVGAIEATADGTALFIGGAFTTINGISRRGIAKYDLVNNQVDPTFLPTASNGTVSDIKLANGSVIAAGDFPKKLVALNPTTGADTGSINITVAGVVDPTFETQIKYIAVNPSGTRLVATGNFATVNGLGRKRAFMMNLAPTSTLSTWYAPRFNVNCAAVSKLISAQGVDFSPDGSYFVVVSTGGPTGTSGVCDAAARFETANVSANAAPTWINWTGGDTLYSVAITGAAVYVGGHQRWLDNPQGRDSAGPGAVERPGIGAINPTTGKALSWNPTKSREHGTMVLFATSKGLWVGSDGTRFGHEDHIGIGFAPLNLGLPADAVRPNTFIDAGPSSSVADTSAAFSFSASEASTFQCRLDGAAFAPCTSPMSYSNLPLGSHTFQVSATDPSLNVDASPATRTWTVLDPAGNRIGNPGFEVDTSGWKGNASANTLSRVAGGHSGGWSAQVSNTVAGGSCGLNDTPNWVNLTQSGIHTASIYARSDTPGLTLRLRVREYASGVQQGSVTATVALSSSWQQVTAAYTPVTPGSTLDYEAYTTSTPAGVCFQVDDASITVATPDTTPPDTFIDSGPSGSVANTSAAFTFSASEPSTFQCRLDAAAFAPCTSPKNYSDLLVGSHTFEVLATDGSLNADPSPATRTWSVLPSGDLVGNPGFEVDTSGWSGNASSNTLSRVAGGHSGDWAAQVSNTVAGGNCGLNDTPNWVSVTKAGVHTASIWARSDTPGLTLKLRLREYASGVQQGSTSTSVALTSSWQQVTALYSPIVTGSSLDFEVFTAATPVGICFQVDDASMTTVDTTPPDTSIDSGPAGSLPDTSAAFSFSASEPSTFQCRLDGAAFAACTSPISYADLVLGSHTFEVRATDSSLNVDATPATRTWTVLDPSSNLIANPGFEVDTSGWNGNAATNTLSQVAGGRSGDWAAQVSNTVAGGSCGLNDTPNWVSVTQAGAYTMNIWVRADTPGFTLRLRVREYSSGVLQGSVTSTVTLTSSWQQVMATYTPVTPGSTLDFEAYTTNSPVGVCFQIDDASITH